MKSLRSNIKHGTRLALFAMAIQFVLAFGHFHAIGSAHAITTPSLSWSEQSAAADTTSSARPLSHEQPSDDDSDRAGDVCAICAVMAMAETMPVAPPPLPLLLLEAVEFSYESRNVPLIRAASRRGVFETRAPPLS